MLTDAIQYRKLGWSVFPACWPVDGKCGCGRSHEGNDIAKAPLVKWGDYKTRLPTMEEIIQWWTMWPNANIACATGAVSGIAVVDLEHEGLTVAQKLGLHSGLISLTGKGRHLIFKWPGEAVCNKVAMAKIRGLDIRGDGGYIILPPSRHQTGKRYRWATGITSHLPVFPSQLIETVSSGGSSPSSTTKTIGKPQGWLTEALEGLSHGNRNNTLAQVVGRLHRDRWTPSDIRSLLLPHAMRVQFPERELDTIIGSVTRYPVEIRGGRFGAGVSGGMQVAGTTQPAEPLIVRRFGADWKDYERRVQGTGVIEFATGFPKFDRVTTGLQRGELLTVAARTETGKTNWLLAVSKTLAAGNKRVLFLSTEMSYERIWKRYIPLGDISELDDANFLVTDDFKPDIPRITKAIEDTKPDIFVFDHINIVGDDNQDLSEFMKGLKGLARQFSIPGIVSAQLNRSADWVDLQTKHKVIPRMSMIKGSGTIEETSAQVLLLHEQLNEPEHKQILGLIEKNRYGEKENIQFILRKHPYRMEEEP